MEGKPYERKLSLMNTYRFAICDDNKAQIEFLSAAVLHWGEKRGIHPQISAFENGESFLFRYAEDKAFDILLLDIEMGQLNGVQLAKTVRQENKEVQIIFITGYMDYISDGYDVEALHYLLKPVSEEKLHSVLDRAAERLKDKKNSLFLNTGDEMVRIPLYTVRYIEVRQNYVTIHADVDYTVKKTLRELEQSLDSSFFRTGRSYIVNLQFIKKVTKTDVYLKDGAVVPLSRGLYNDLNQAIIRYF